MVTEKLIWVIGIVFGRRDALNQEAMDWMKQNVFRDGFMAPAEVSGFAEETIDGSNAKQDPVHPVNPMDVEEQSTERKCLLLELCDKRKIKRD